MFQKFTLSKDSPLYTTDLKANKFAFLSQHLNQNEKGVYHIKRRMPSLNPDEIKALFLYDLTLIRKYIDEIKSIHTEVISDQDNKVSFITATMRLNNDSILSLVQSSQQDATARLEFNFAIPGQVIEYDDRHHQNILSEPQINLGLAFDNEIDADLFNETMTRFEKELSL